MDLRIGRSSSKYENEIQLSRTFHTLVTSNIQKLRVGLKVTENVANAIYYVV
jgi:hypothetical protein